jgi:hypothetical protein
MDLRTEEGTTQDMEEAVIATDTHHHLMPQVHQMMAKDRTLHHIVHQKKKERGHHIIRESITLIDPHIMERDHPIKVARGLTMTDRHIKVEIDRHMRVDIKEVIMRDRTHLIGTKIDTKVEIITLASQITTIDLLTILKMLIQIKR